MAKKNEVAIIENFDLQVISEDLKEAIAEEMDGLGTIPFDRIKVPAGGSLAWDIPTEDPDAPESATELVGVILYHHPINAYWKDAFTGGNAQPDCASMDAKKGVDPFVHQMTRQTGRAFRADLSVVVVAGVEGPSARIICLPDLPSIR